jgi:hypothetical protein
VTVRDLLASSALFHAAEQVAHEIIEAKSGRPQPGVFKRSKSLFDSPAR